MKELLIKIEVPEFIEEEAIRKKVKNLVNQEIKEEIIIKLLEKVFSEAKNVSDDEIIEFSNTLKKIRIEELRNQGLI